MSTHNDPVVFRSLEDYLDYYAADKEDPCAGKGEYYRAGWEAAKEACDIAVRVLADADRRGSALAALTGASVEDGNLCASR